MPGHARLMFSLLAATTLQACSVWPEPPARPANVPMAAVRLGGPKAYWWVSCVYEDRVNRCTVFNAGGVILEDNSVYRPYDGGAPVPSYELRIETRHSSIDCLYLENGRILILERAFDFHKRAIDFERGLGR